MKRGRKRGMTKEGGGRAVFLSGWFSVPTHCKLRSYSWNLIPHRDERRRTDPSEEFACLLQSYGITKTAERQQEEAHRTAG